ncbi:MAG TPA: tetratricopeptide repeat protein [Candidatus Acidoferrales bacterium]|nr:tetratricopeptide repeat protein [Candidatus Acidoferrales bacterium]
MAFNKNKALESALKFLNQGKVAQAIGEYQQILRQDPKDQATLMTVGDLFARQGEMPQAIEYFERLAQVYLSDGFNSKAIAIYKKIAKLAPAELPPLERLADLYVQQGVLSEARPLFLQIAEAHLKANHAPKAVEVLNRLLEVEPENPRVQMRLAELYNVMGQKKEAAQTYLSYAQRLFDRGEGDEAQKLIERALGVDATNAPALLLKAKILGMANKNEQAIAILDTHPEADAGGEVTNLLMDLEINSGQLAKAADRARRQLARGSAHSGPLQRVADSLIEAGQPDQALPLLRELREPMIETGEQDRFQKLLSTAAEKLPGETEPLEMLADFCRHTSDPFPLNAALSQLVDAYAAAGNFTRAEEVMQEMLEHNKGDERLVARFDQLRARRSGSPEPVAQAAPPPPTDVGEATTGEEPAAEAGSVQATFVESAPSAATQAADDTFDDETQRYIAQALTDVDLFSSYGLTQKATHLLENVLQRAPRHTPTLERLLDLYLGAGNERRTAELASQLEQIHRERQDTVNADRFAELRQRFQKLSGLTAEELAPTPVAQVQAPEAETAEPPATIEAASAAAPVEEASAHPAPVEFEIPLIPVEPEPAVAEAPPPAAEPEQVQVEAAPVEPQPVAASEEVDLSDEWEAMAQEVAEPAAAEPAAPEPVQAEAEEERIEIEVPQEEEPVQAQEVVAEPAPPEPSIELIEEPAEAARAPETVAAGNGEFELELTPEPAGVQGKAGPATTEDFLSELAAEIDGLETPASTAKPAPVAAASALPAVSEPIPETTAESLNELAEVFQEFRSELGEMEDEEEDLETHYNLGIAYREMGLLDEAIGEFQKVAKAVQKGKPFPYAMNCSTLLALSFMDKGEAKIAALWYERALEVPGLDQEAILALRYDLAMALDMAGEATAALDSFRQVYAMNIDYRDVADRIATLQKH